jgi:uncharacterized membrane protein
MIREHLFHKRAPADPMFRWRGEAVSRLEALSDGVFALTLALLIVTGAVPTQFYELWKTVRDLPVFLASFAMLMMAWHYHYIFFRRYGLEDFATSMLNAAFLFLIMFLAYPLKFLAVFLWRIILGDHQELGDMFRAPAGVAFELSEEQQRAWMMIFYAAAIIGVFGLLALMQWRAYAKRKQLELDKLETYLTVTGLIHHLISVGVALISLIIILADGQPGWAGIVYFLLGPIHGVCGWLRGRRASQLHQELLAK